MTNTLSTADAITHLTVKGFTYAFASDVVGAMKFSASHDCVSEWETQADFDARQADARLTPENLDEWAAELAQDALCDERSITV